MRQRLVLVAAAIGAFSGRSSNWPICYELRGISARDGYGAGPFVTHGAAPADLQR
jgi:hypothetical protein